MRIRAKEFRNRLVLVVWAKADYSERVQLEIEIKALEEEVHSAASQINDATMSAEPSAVSDPIPDVKVAEFPLARLRSNLVASFDDSELRALCFDMGVDYESLGGKGKAGNAMELVAYCERRQIIPDLVAKCRDLRPNVSWEDDYE